jgi:Tol biopolymer transport system component
MKTIKKFSILCLHLSAAILLSGCGTTLDWPKTTPDRDILFQSNVRRPFELYFINEDGSNHQLLEVPQNFVKPIWSFDGQTIYGLSNPLGRFPYEGMGYPAYWNIKSGNLQICAKNLPYYQKIQAYGNRDRPNEVILNNVSEIVTFDLDTCQQTRMLVDFNQRRGEYGIYGFSYFPETQELVYGRETAPYPSAEYRLIKLNLQTNEQVELADGINPAWSPDGTYIAYVGFDGLYVMAEDGTQPRQIIKAKFFDPNYAGSPSDDTPQLSWSPDGEWLAYHHCVETSAP